MTLAYLVLPHWSPISFLALQYWRTTAPWLQEEVAESFQPDNSKRWNAEVARPHPSHQCGLPVHQWGSSPQQTGSRGAPSGRPWTPPAWRSCPGPAGGSPPARRWPSSTPFFLPWGNLPWRRAAPSPETPDSAGSPPLRSAVRTVVAQLWTSPPQKQSETTHNSTTFYARQETQIRNFETNVWWKCISNAKFNFWGITEINGQNLTTKFG